ncbi:MAG: PAS-domain containing protein [Pseudomonadota bacterium]
MSFLFDDGVLHHASLNAQQTFALLPGTHVWADLRESLVSRFSQFPETAACDSIGSITILPDSKEDPGILTLRWRDCLCWIELTEQATQLLTRDGAYRHAKTTEAIADALPYPAWEIGPTGQVCWRNPAYDALLSRCADAQNDVIFKTSTEQDVVRIPLKSVDGDVEWFEVCTRRSGTSTVHIAIDVTALKHAEDAQRKFVQTLAKTFAQLPIGLAIFDRKRQLSIFNPALVDLTDLQPEYLSRRPTMLSFFDALREARRMPEPKNYNAWRQEITAMIAAASDGQYNESWTLEDGRTYTVQGRPHPDGATAFLIEDISAEISRTRNYRSEVELYEGLLNSVDDALVVFSSGGVATFSNAAYHRAWGQNPEYAFADVTVFDAIRVWQEKADADWGLIAQFIKTLGSRQELFLPISHGPSGMSRIELKPIGSEATLVRFCTTAAETEIPPKRRDFQAAG